jgi:type II secretory pathway component GspD/PulD (secretin)
MPIQLSSIFLILLFQTASIMASEMDIIELHNRPAEEIIPLIEPMLDAGESINGKGFQLILKADTARQSQIRELVSKLDRAQAQLMITVFQGSERDMKALGIDTQVKVNDNSVQAKATTIGTRSRMQDNPVHHLRLTEGTSGYIETGKSVPYFSGAYGGVGLGRGVVGADVEFKDVTTGFYVLPRLNGDMVILDVSPHSDSLDSSRPGAIKTSRAATTISGQLGQWIPLGGTTEQASRSTKKIGSTHSTQDIWASSPSRKAPSTL